MRTTLDVEERTARKLREIATATGVSVDQLLATYVSGLQAPGGKGAGADEVVAAFDQWLESFPQHAPPLSDEATSRVSIYLDR
jgi:hypothetical protein